jgi:hypothetical protein
MSERSPSDEFLLVKAADSRKWHWFESDADECFCGNVKSFAIVDRVDPGSFGERDISQTCRSAFRAATRTGGDSR